MRVTQSMLSSNLLRNLNNSYSKLGKLDNQIALGGKKFTRPSDDPVASMLAMNYRSDLGRIQQYQKNIGDAKSWVDSTDDALDQVGKALQKIRELTVQASNDPLEEGQRAYIATEIEELQKQIVSLGDSEIGGKFIFGGTKTDTPPSESNFADATGTIELEVFNGIKLPVNTEGKALFADFTSPTGDIQKLIDDLRDPNVSGDALGEHLGAIDAKIDHFLTARANVGATQNRVDMMEDRLGNQEVISSKILSNNENEDIEKLIVDLTVQESIHRAALSVGTRIIQPSLVDFLR